MVAILSKVDDFGLGAENTDAVGLEVCREIKRCLAAKLRDNADRLFFVIYRKNILKGQRLKIELVRCVIIRRDGLRIAVDDDRLKSETVQRLSCMYAAVIEFNTLADPVGTTAEDHDLRAVGRDRIIVLRVVSGVVVSAVLGAADMNSIPGLDDSELLTLRADLFLRDFENLAEVLV